jgi:hypothetical protein
MSKAMNKYECFWKSKRITVEANTTYQAQQKAQEILKVKKGYEIAVVLAEKNGQAYIHIVT